MQGPIFARKGIRKLSESMVQIKMMKVRTGKLIYLYIHLTLQSASRPYHSSKVAITSALAVDQRGWLVASR